MSISRRLLISICNSLLIVTLFVVAIETSTLAARTTVQGGQAITPVNSPVNTGHHTLNPRRSLRRAAEQEQKPKTIAEVQKNIKVLGEFPQSQLIPMMNLMAASLGVRCNYCHVNKSGQWDYAADEKPEKNSAREMITMTLNINKTTASTNKEVGCFTCHRGRTSPMGVVSLPVPEPVRRGGPGGGPGGQPGQPAGPGGAVGTGGPAAPAQAAIPTADDILNKYVTALGGQAAIDRVKTRVMTGTYTAANGMTANFQVDQAAPDKFHLTFTLPQGAMERGFNGSAGWEKGPRGVTDLGGPQLADMKAAFGLFTDVNLKGQFTRMTVRKDRVGDRDVYVIGAAAADGHRERLYFDAETGLLLSRTSATQTPIGVIPQETNFEDYRDVDGMKVPIAIRTLTVDQQTTATRKYSEIKANAPVNDAIFNKPVAAAPESQPKP